jgi:alkanesulfonate monooxygenase SsuD/methylene tetrahydromethanopterin reductase-like flavin-dependent oxidoreductase (luciferase family)
MPYSVVRFNCIQPGLEPEAMGKRYRAFVEMAGYADEHDLQAISLEEHHGAENGWSPSPLVMAGLVFGRTQKIMATISVLVPLHDLRIAEDITVLDLARRPVDRHGRYRLPGERARPAGRTGRAALRDGRSARCSAWTGEPFEFHRTTVQVTPIRSRNHVRMLGGSVQGRGALRRLRAMPPRAVYRGQGRRLRYRRAP